MEATVPRLAPARLAVEKTASASSNDSTYRRSLKRLTLLLLLIGLVVRCERYLLAFPIWGDEAFITTNIAERDYEGLTKKLEWSQVAPILFLWSERAIYLTLGSSEYALRLMPFLLGCASLGLMAYIARQTVSRLAGMLAVGLLSVAIWPVSMSNFVKPYSFDLFFSLALLAAAINWHRRPDRPARLALLAVIVPIAILGSFPSVFVAGGISLALLPTVWKQSGIAAKGWHGLFNLLMIACFVGHYQLVGKEQLDRETHSINQFLLNYWADAFPPASLVKWPLWFLGMNTGRMFAYPSGDSNGGSTLTLLAFLAGCVVWWRSRRRALLTMMLVPFALNLLASILHKYPYGGCCRLSQHLAPAICLLAGTGLAALIELRTADPGRRSRYARFWFGLFALVAAGTLFHQTYRPYRDIDALWNRNVAAELARVLRPGDRVVVVDRPIDVGAVPTWYLSRLSRAPSWAGKIAWDELPPEGCLWIVDIRRGSIDESREARIRWLLQDREWKIQGSATWFMPTPHPGELHEAYRCDVFWCTQPGHEVPPPRFSQAP